MWAFLIVGLLLSLLYPDISDPSSLTERTSNDKCLESSDDTTYIAKTPHTKH